MHTGEALHLRSITGRVTLVVTILASGMAFLDTTVVNVAAKRIGQDFHTTFGALQWVLNAYALTLASLILLGGALGDRLGRKRVFVVGAAWFALASLACALAPNVIVLIAARAVQGVGGALMTPGSLAIISASFVPGDRPRAIGIWAGSSGIATALGPLLGGWLVEYFSWRWAFAINLPLAAAVVVLGIRHVPESRATHDPRRLDVAGTALIAAALAGLTFGTIRAGGRGWDSLASSATVAGALLVVAFVVAERHSSHPIVPLGLFRNATFSATNAMTLLTYAALGAVMFVLVLHLQVAAGYGALAAGLATLPVTIVMILGSARSAALAARIGPRTQLVAGPLLAAAGLALLLRVDPAHSGYALDVLPGVVVYGAGMVTIVAPLTATVMGSAPSDDVGVASGVNNAIARAGGLLAVAVLPPLAGLQGEAYRQVPVMVHGYRVVIACSAGLLAVAAAVIALTMRGNRTRGAIDVDDKTILSQINELVDEERQLRASRQGLDGDGRQRLQALEQQLDQCWDLLRQRRAREDTGEDPDDARTRSVNDVESYLQ